MTASRSSALDPCEKSGEGAGVRHQKPLFLALTQNQPPSHDIRELILHPKALSPTTPPPTIHENGCIYLSIISPSIPIIPPFLPSTVVFLIPRGMC